MEPGFTITVNGVAREVASGPERSLLEVLREELGVTGPKPGCGEGVCGACTVGAAGPPGRDGVHHPGRRGRRAAGHDGGRPRSPRSRACEARRALLGKGPDPLREVT